MHRSGDLDIRDTVALESMFSADHAEHPTPIAKLIIATIGTPLVVIDERFHIRTANPAFCRSFRTTTTAVVGSSLFVVDEGRWDTPVFRAAVQEVFQTGKELFESEIEHALSDTEWRVFQVSCKRIDASVERLLLITFHDISERKRMADAVAWHSAELKRSNLELEQFAYVSSHDLQEPLRKIRAYGDLLVAEAGEALNETAGDYLKRMINAAARMQILINDLLAYSRVATKPPVPKLIDLNKIVADVLVDLDVALKQAGAVVTVAELPQIEADPLQLRQVFQNLIGNALKFAGADRPVTVQVTCSVAAPDTGTASSVSPDTVYQFRVSDNGIGFDQQYAESIFAPFQRLHSRKQYAGTGIGLAICRRIIERHAGTIRAQGSLGVGANFEFTLPARQLQTRRTP